MTPEQQALTANIILNLHPFTAEERLGILVPLVSVHIKPEDGKTYGRVLHSILHDNQNAIPIVSAAVVAFVVLKHHLEVTADQLVDVGDKLEEQVLLMLLKYSTGSGESPSEVRH